MWNKEKRGESEKERGKGGRFPWSKKLMDKIYTRVGYCFKDSEHKYKYTYTEIKKEYENVSKSFSSFTT